MDNASGARGSSPTPTLEPTPTETPIPGRCIGDCNDDGVVASNELITLVNITLGNLPKAACTAGDVNGDGRILVNEILLAVRNALDDCSLRLVAESQR